jgi:bacterioferritin
MSANATTAPPKSPAASTATKTGKAPSTDVKAMRQRARQNIESGAVTEDYRGDREAILELLDQALATELLCVLRYKRHYFMAYGMAGQNAAAEFLEHANQEQGHADAIAKRIVQLRGAPDLNPDTLSRRSHAEYVQGSTVRDMVKEDLIAERIAIDSYRDMVEYIGEHDPTTRRMLEEILAVEEEHADDLVTLLEGMPE